MMMHSSLRFLVLLATAGHLVLATSIADIQGTKFQSPFAGKKVTGVQGVVTAKSAKGFWISNVPTKGSPVSAALTVYTNSSTDLSKVSVGDLISLGGTVVSYRSTTDKNGLSVVELQSPTSIVVHSKSAKVTPIVLEKARTPPTGPLSALDKGPDGFLSVPNDASSVDSTNAIRQPSKYGLDFWQSLSGQLVTVPGPVAIDFNDRYGSFWVHGGWDITGKNSRGGLSMVLGSDKFPTPHPETVVIGKPLDGSKNPTVSIGTTLSDITGIVQYEYNYFTILPLTAPKVKKAQSSVTPSTNITSSRDACTITVGDYNVENLSPTSSHMDAVAAHIAKNLNSPDLVFVQEIQDDSGGTNDGVVTAKTTLTNLVAAITKAGSKVKYSFVDIDPVNDQDGGVPGGNIRQAYLYNPSKVSLVPGSKAGSAKDATKVTKDSKGLTLSYNPGRIDPTNAAWKSSRKPLAAVWQTSSGKRFFTVNVQLTAKLGSSSTWGDARPPINGGVAQRTKQVQAIADFTKSILTADSKASIVVGGDCNEYLFTTSVFKPFSGLLTDIDSVAKIPPEERYTYVYAGVSEQLDHLFVSDAIKARGVRAEHVHVNNWAASLAKRASDHDPTVGQIKVC
ncbi:DNase I-like protein [Hygrophoropsis aurantiaca]|uniref:DNase I-like protein n=1 Tax=Hygrophoropsis aurantiaca TaxID=72124 RepID=A0ACB8A9I7_9AGAM|nr:DNase I-like protein [Hygrophoropsis aurantiaca]